MEAILDLLVIVLVPVAITTAAGIIARRVLRRQISNQKLEPKDRMGVGRIQG
jgi:hypothetical protein